MKGEERERHLTFRVLRPLLKHRLVASKVIANLDLLQDFKINIIQLEKRLPQSEVVDELLHCLEIVSKKAVNWFTLFVSAVINAGYHDIGRILNDQVSNRECYDHLMENVYDVLVEVGNPSDSLLLLLKGERIIMEKDIVDINIATKDESSGAGMSLLITRLQFLNPKWYEKLISSFTLDCQVEIVDALRLILSEEQASSRTTSKTEKERHLVFKVLRPILKHQLCPSKVIVRLAILRDFEEKIIRMEKKLPRAEAVNEFLECLSKVSEGSSIWFHLFATALIESGYNDIGHILKYQEKIFDAESYYKLLENAYDILINVGKASDILLRRLRLGRVIKDRDIADIEAANAKDSELGMCLLLCRIPFQCSEWLEKLATSFSIDGQLRAADALRQLQSQAISNDLSNTLSKQEQLYRWNLVCNKDSEKSSKDTLRSEIQSIETNDRVPDPIGDFDILDEEDDLMLSKPADIVLRSFQEELVSKTFRSRKNIVLLAPTGCGKTCVAAEIIKLHHTKNRGCRVAFLAPTNALVRQQNHRLSRYLASSGIVVEELNKDETSKVTVKTALSQGCNVLCMTPQLLVNACESQELTEFGFTLIILDECHHSRKSHPYNIVLGFYWDGKLAGKPVPWVVGLTASVGIGDATDCDGGVNFILEYLAHMDADLVTVEIHKRDLERFINKPVEITVQSIERPQDKFRDCITAIMTVIEEKINTHQEVISEALHEIESYTMCSVNPPSDKKHLNYSKWFNYFISELLVKIDDDDIKHDITVCIDYLAVYHNTLLINADCRSADALAFLKKEFYHNLMRDNPRPIDSWLAGMIEGELVNLQVYSTERNDNPQLDNLRTAILTKKSENPEENINCMVFCRTRQICASLKSWANETKELNALNAEYLTGKTASPEKNGLTEDQQDEVLKSFGDGRCQLIFSTNVSEEGIDVPTCNIVIRYQCPTSLIASVQSRGRARKEDSTFVVVANRTLAKKYAKNKEKETIQNEAVEKIISMNARLLSWHIDQEQKKLIAKRQEMHEKAEMRKNEKMNFQQQGKDYMLFCKYCSTYGSPSDDIRVINGCHYVVYPSEDFLDKVTSKAKPKQVGAWTQTSQLLCKDCGEVWGHLYVYKGHQFPVIKLSNFHIITPNGRKIYCKKWKDVPFFVEKLQVVDLYDED